MKSSSNVIALLATVIVAGVAPSAAHADSTGLTAYYTQATFIAAFELDFPGMTLASVGFDDLGQKADSFSSYGSNVPITDDGVSVSDSGTAYLVAVPAFGIQDGTTVVATTFNTQQTVTASGPALGFNIISNYPADDNNVPAIATDSEGHTLSSTFTATNATGTYPLGFVGFIDTNPGASIQSIVVGPNAGPSIDNVLFAAPEPSTWALMIVGSGLLLAFSATCRPKLEA